MFCIYSNKIENKFYIYYICNYFMEMKKLYQKIIGRIKKDIDGTLKVQGNFQKTNQTSDKLEKYMTQDQIDLQTKLCEMEQINPSYRVENLDSESKVKAYNNFRKEILETYKLNNKVKKSLNEDFNNNHHNYSSYKDKFSEPKIVLTYNEKDKELIGEDENCEWFNKIRIPFNKIEKEFSHDCLMTKSFKNKREYDLKINVDDHNFYFLDGKLTTNQRISGGMGGISSYLEESRIKPFYEKKMYLLIKSAESELKKILVDDEHAFLKNPHLTHDDFKLINPDWYTVEK